MWSQKDVGGAKEKRLFGHESVWAKEGRASWSRAGDGEAAVAADRRSGVGGSLGKESKIAKRTNLEDGGYSNEKPKHTGSLQEIRRLRWPSDGDPRCLPV